MPNDTSRVLTLADGTELEVAHGAECVLIAAHLADHTTSGRLLGIVLDVDQARTLAATLEQQADLATIAGR